MDNPSRSFGHDAAGNTFADQRGQAGWTANHDLSGRIDSHRASLDGRLFTTVFYLHNADGLRIYKQIQLVEDCPTGPNGPCNPLANAARPTAYVYDQQGQLLGEYDGVTGEVRREYVWLQGAPVVVVDGPPANPAIFYIHTDHLGTPRVAFDRAGRQRWSWVAEPFGNSSPVTNPLGLGDWTLNLRMPGQYFDVETGLSYNWHRTYDAGVGRYTQSDPIGLAGGINTYAYVENNPLSYTDPMGLDRWGDQPGFRWGTKPGVPLPEGDNSRLYVFTMCVQACYGEPIIVTSTNEPYKGHGPGTAHGDSAAIDLRYSAMRDPDKALCCAAQRGARYGLDEMKNPSKHSSAPHFHLELAHPRNKNWSRGNLPASDCLKC